MKYLIFSSLFVVASCTNSALQKELEQAQNELKAAQETILQLEQASNTSGQLVHIVLFKLKSDADETAMLTEINKLEAIGDILELEAGIFENLGDPRALSEYTVIMEMSFADSVAYQKYQQHPIHLALKENVQPYLAGPPATYDFVAQ
jgi:hypothetical protein